MIAGLSYFLLAVSTISLTSNGQEIAAVWAADSVLLAIMLQRPRPSWSMILAAGFIANICANVVTRGASLGPVLYGFANMSQVLLVAWGYCRHVKEGSTYSSPKAVLTPIMWAGLIGPAWGSLLGATTAWYLFGEPFFRSFAVWYLSNALGLLIFGPFFFSLFRGDLTLNFKSKTWPQRLEALSLLALTAATAAAIFSVSHLPILFLMFMPLMLVTFRLGWCETKLAVLIVAVAVVIATVQGDGPMMLAHLSGYERAIFAQFFLASLLVLQLPVAAVLISQKEAMARLLRNEHSTRVLAQEAGILILSLDIGGKCIKSVGAAKRLLGLEETEIIGSRIIDLSRESAEDLRRAFDEINSEDAFDQLLEIRAPHDPDRWLEIRFSALDDGPTTRYETLVTIRDVTGQKVRENSLAKQAHTDDLTGLFNRTGFTDGARRKLARSHDKGVYLAMIDVDRFKQVNDTLGHLAGDAVLASLGKTMKRHVRSTDILGRLGGDEFALLLDVEAEHHARQICESIVAAVASTPAALPGGESISVSISCGLARYRQGTELEMLKHEADMALYAAKRRGRNQMAAA